MRRRIVKTLQAIAAGLMMLCIFCGILLMMCESADSHTQMGTLFGGFVLFILGAIPALLIAAFGRSTHGNL